MITTIWTFITSHWIALGGGAAAIAALAAAVALLGPAGVVAALSKVPGWVWMLALCVALIYLYGEHERAAGEQSVQAKWDVSKAAQAKVLALANDRAEKAEASMKTKVKETEDDRDNKIKAANDERDAALVQLRNRPGRRTDANAAGSGTTGQCAGASGAELSKEDASFLTGEAARADTYVIELNACNAKYDEVAELLNRLADQSAGIGDQVTPK